MIETPLANYRAGVGCVLEEVLMRHVATIPNFSCQAVGRLRASRRAVGRRRGRRLGQPRDAGRADGR